LILGTFFISIQKKFNILESGSKNNYMLKHYANTQLYRNVIYFTLY